MAPKLKFRVGDRFSQLFRVEGAGEGAFAPWEAEITRIEPRGRKPSNALVHFKGVQRYLGEEWGSGDEPLSMGEVVRRHKHYLKWLTS